jgi:hypothetical protein
MNNFHLPMIKFIYTNNPKNTISYNHNSYQTIPIITDTNLYIGQLTPAISTFFLTKSNNLYYSYIYNSQTLQTDIFPANSTSIFTIINKASSILDVYAFHIKNDDPTTNVEEHYQVPANGGRLTLKVTTKIINQVLYFTSFINITDLSICPFTCQISCQSSCLPLCSSDQPRKLIMKRCPLTKKSYFEWI